MKHLTPAQLSAHLDLALSGKPIQEVELHLEACAECRAALAALEAQDRRLAAASMFDPGDAYFESFAARVEERLQREAARGGFAPVPGLFDWITSPRRVAIAGGIVAATVGVALVLVMARHTEMPSMQNTEIATHGEQVAPPSTSSAPVPAPDVQSNALRARGPSDPRFRPAPVPAGGESQRAHLDDASQAKTRPRGAAPDEIASGEGVRTERDDLGKSASSSRAVRLRERAAEDRPNTGTTPGFALAPPPQTAAPPAPSAATPSRVVKPKAAPLADAVAKVAKQARQSAEKPGTSATLGEARTGRESPTAPRLQSEGLRAVAGADRVRVCGRVVDDQGRAIVGANVAVAEFGASVVTNSTGSFCIEAPAGNHTLVAMSVGFDTVRRPITVGAEGSVEITMHAIPVLETPVAPRTVLRYRPGASAAADTFSRWPDASRDAAREAQRLAIRGTQSRSAADFDRAAGEWAKALGRTEGTEFEILVRQHLADARFRAWEIAPTRARTQNAIQALTAFIARAPLGATREQAGKRLDRVKR
jgi:hypothetical protein